MMNKFENYIQATKAVFIWANCIALNASDFPTAFSLSPKRKSQSGCKGILF